MVDQYKEKFIAYIDVVGFKGLVEASESGRGMPLAELKSLVACLDDPNRRSRFEQYGPAMCPQSLYIERNLDFLITRANDCALVTAEVSPAGVINLIDHCWEAVINLLQRGILCRGYITQGKIHHTELNQIGTGLQRAVEGEKNVTAFQQDANDRGTPFVEIDKSVCDYIRQYGDECVKKMFDRLTRNVGDVAALFPFKAISHKFAIGPGFPPFEPGQHLKSNNNVRKMLITMKEKVKSYANSADWRAMKKISHYLDALDAQLTVCDRTDAIIRQLAAKPE